MSNPHPLLQDFIDQQAGNCGNCLFGMLGSTRALFHRTARDGSHLSLRLTSRDPSRDRVRCCRSGRRTGLHRGRAFCEFDVALRHNHSFPLFMRTTL